MSLQNFIDWKTLFVSWLAAETAGSTLTEESEDSVRLMEFVEPVELETETFNGASVYSPAATIAYKTAYSRVQAHRRDFPSLAQERSAYYEEQAEDENTTVELLDELQAALMRMAAFQET